MSTLKLLKIIIILIHCLEAAAVSLFKKFDEGRNNFEGEMTSDALTKFVAGNALPLVIDFNQETAQKIFSGEIKSHLLMFVSAKADEYAAQVCRINIASRIFTFHRNTCVSTEITNCPVNDLPAFYFFRQIKIFISSLKNHAVKLLFYDIGPLHM